MHHLITKYAPKPNEDKGILSVLIECDETERLFIGRIAWNIFEEYILNIFSSAGFDMEQYEGLDQDWYEKNVGQYIDHLETFVQEWSENTLKGVYRGSVRLEPYIEPKMVVDDHIKKGYEPDGEWQLKEYGFVELEDCHSSAYFIY